MPYLPRLDALRAVFAIAIIFYHTHVPGFAWGWMGVPFFFTLSGYVVTASLGRDDNLFRFYCKRAARILPAYMALVCGLTLAYVATGHPEHWRESGIWVATFSTNIAAAFIPGFDLGYWGHTWSLAVEAQFYLLWPLLLRRFNPRTLCIGLVLLSPLLRFLDMRLMETASGKTDWAFMLPTHHLDAFALGASLTVLPVRRVLQHSLSACMALALAGVWGAASLWRFPHLSWDTFGYTQQIDNLSYQMMGGMVTSLLAAVWIARESNTANPAPRWSNSRGLQHLGKISYGIYLYHIPIMLLILKFMGGLLHRFFGPLNPHALGVLVLTLSVLIAEASFRVIERPFLRIKNTRRDGDLNAVEVARP